MVTDAEVEAALHSYYPGCKESTPSWKEWAQRGGYNHFEEMRAALEAAAAASLVKSTKLVGVMVPLDLSRKQLDRLSNMLTCTDEEAVETWAAIHEIFNQ